MQRTTAPGNRIIRTVYRPVWTGNVGSIVTIPNPGVYTHEWEEIRKASFV